MEATKLHESFPANAFPYVARRLPTVAQQDSVGAAAKERALNANANLGRLVLPPQQFVRTNCNMALGQRNLSANHTPPHTDYLTSSLEDLSDGTRQQNPVCCHRPP
jgi:hypothetical protein